MTYHWYALHIKPHKERVVCELLQSMEMIVYYPAVKVKPVNPRSRKERPFFPGYLFVNLDLQALGPNVLRWTEGVHGLVQFGGVPATVPENLIHEIERRLKQIQVEGSQVVKQLKPGDRVKITSGVFEGYEAIFDARLAGKDRVQILLSYLRGQPKRLQIDSSHIIKI